MAITKIQSESLNLADTYAFTGTVTGAGESNVPAFFAVSSTTGETTFISSTDTKVNMGTEILDTDNCYSSSRFTPTTAGYYYLHGQIGVNSMNDQDSVFIKIYKNGSYLTGSFNATASPATGYGILINTSLVVYMNGSSDYVELYGYQNNASNKTNWDVTCKFGGFLLTT